MDSAGKTRLAGIVNILLGRAAAAIAAIETPLNAVNLFAELNMNLPLSLNSFVHSFCIEPLSECILNPILVSNSVDILSVSPTPFHAIVGHNYDSVVVDLAFREPLGSEGRNLDKRRFSITSYRVGRACGCWLRHFLGPQLCR